MPTGLAADAPIDLVFVDFIQAQLLGIVNSLQSAKTFGAADVKPYSDVLTSEMWGKFAQSAWQ